MRFAHIVFVAAMLAATLSIGCTDTCRQRCDFAADFYEGCLPEWNSNWSNLGYDSKSAFMSACMDSVNVAREQVADCCSAESDSDLSQEQIDDYLAECEHNTLLAIDRNCEDNKEYYRQPCSEYWQQVFDPAAEPPPESNPTCQDVDGDDDDDVADDDTAG